MSTNSIIFSIIVSTLVEIGYYAGKTHISDARRSTVSYVMNTDHPTRSYREVPSCKKYVPQMIDDHDPIVDMSFRWWKTIIVPRSNFILKFVYLLLTSDLNSPNKKERNVHKDQRKTKVSNETTSTYDNRFKSLDWY